MRYFYEWESCPEPTFHALHTTLLLPTAGPVERGFTFPIKDPYHRAEKKTENVFLNRLLSIPGIQRITSSSYQLLIGKARLFAWPEIHQQVLGVIRETLLMSGDTLDPAAVSGIRETPGHPAVEGHLA